MDPMLTLSMLILDIIVNLEIPILIRFLKLLGISLSSLFLQMAKLSATTILLRVPGRSNLRSKLFVVLSESIFLASNTKTPRMHLF